MLRFGETFRFGFRQAWVDNKRARRGFALLITITFLAFLVLLAVSLASLTRVETAVADNHRHLAQARHHALMALNIALGQLQAHAGPDSRLTAQANLLGENVANPWFTGVWTADAAGTPVLRSWLVSGNETNPTLYGPHNMLGREESSSDTGLVLNAAGVAINGPESVNPNRVRLVGAASASDAGAALGHGGVVVPGVPLNVEVPGLAGARTVGRYAFWVGDQGVKASLALPDRAEEVVYAPWFDSAARAGHDQRARIRQQIATAPAFFRRLAGGESRGFDPLDAVNATRLARVLTGRHLDLLQPAVESAPLAAFRREFFHAFTDRASGVLANTLPLTATQRGLQRDLSQAPELLGPAFVAQSDIAAHMETPALLNTAVPPITTKDSARRRHRLTAPVVSAATAIDPEIEFRVSPVLNSFLLQFRVARGTAGAVEIKARLFVELWNPYSVSLVPEALTLEITGLPEIVVTDAGRTATVALQNPPAFLTDGSSTRPLLVRLPFVANGNTDRSSLLPGRLYAWRTDTAPPPTAALRFYDKILSSSWNYLNVPMGATHDALRVDSSQDATLTVRLKRADGSVLATYVSPKFPAFSVADVEAPAVDANWKFGFGFRLSQPSALNRDRDWLTQAGRDFRRQNPPASLFGAFNESLDLDPDAYVGTPSTSTDVKNFLLFRAMGLALASTRSANLDSPVFELPRLPYLSVGELQHLTLPANRPFSVGNAWGGAVNAWFDRFFFSGITASGARPDISAGQPLPNWNLQPLEVRATTAGALSSQYLLQAGAFNVNSALPEAWRAVLSGVRFSQARAFRRAGIDNHPTVTAFTGSQSDPASASAAVVEETLADATLSDDTDVGGPAFFRFPQTAQETYFWSGTAIEGEFYKQAFRQGVRGGDDAIDGSTLHTLTTTQIDRLAKAVAMRVREHTASAGPYASLQDFLAANPAWSGRNLLGQAVADSGINAASITPDDPVANTRDIGLCSLTLTSADVMTALAPYLRTRSDTFLVRTYGEVLNPATQAVSGRAWCEALVQRLPAPLDSTETNIAAPAPTGFGRAFRITQFRWLSPADI